MQRRLHLGIYPMCPYPANDHGVKWDPIENRQPWLDYGAMMAAMKGKKWVMEPHCVEIAENTAQANMFETLEGWVVPITFGKAPQASVLLRNMPFISGSTLPLRVSNIGVAEWDGVLDQMPEPRAGLDRRRDMFGMGTDEEATPAAEEKPDEIRMELANGDSLAGEVSAIHDGIITVNSPLGEIKLPVSRLRTVTLKPVEAERSKRRNGDIRAWFHDGSSIVFNLESSDDETLTGSSQNFGTATFRTAAFNRIEFNIYSPEFEDLRRADEW